MYGLQLVEDSKGRLKRGTVYVTLGRMEEKGLIESELEPSPAGHGGLPRRLYRATGHGIRVFQAYEAMARTFSVNREVAGEAQ